MFKKLKNWMNHDGIAFITCAIVAAAIASCNTGCEETPPEFDSERYFIENGRQARAMTVTITEPATGDKVIQANVGDNITIKVQGGLPPYTWTVEPRKGYVVWDPEDSRDERTFLYVAETAGRCTVTVQDKREDYDFLSFENIGTNGLPQ